jgi:hypothetical protein
MATLADIEREKKEAMRAALLANETPEERAEREERERFSLRKRRSGGRRNFRNAGSAKSRETDIGQVATRCGIYFTLIRCRLHWWRADTGLGGLQLSLVDQPIKTCPLDTADGDAPGERVMALTPGGRGKMCI